MAYVDGNDLTLGLRGSFGKQFIFRRFGKKTIASRRSVYAVSRSEAQQRHRERFRLATLYAKRCVAHPETKAEYENIARVTDKWSAFATAVGDYLVPVSVERIDISHFTGRSGSPVFVAVNDRYKVRTIVVTVTTMSGDVIERGHATFVSGNEYVYKTVTSELSDVVVKVEVADRPGVVVETPVESRPRSVDENVRPEQESCLMQAPYTVRSFSFETSALSPVAVQRGFVNRNGDKFTHPAPFYSKYLKEPTAQPRIVFYRLLITTDY
jgi:hypothetical protein